MLRASRCALCIRTMRYSVVQRVLASPGQSAAGCLFNTIAAPIALLKTCHARRNPVSVCLGLYVSHDAKSSLLAVFAQDFTQAVRLAEDDGNKGWHSALPMIGEARVVREGRSPLVTSSLILDI